MAEESESDRLRRLEARINAHRAKEAPKANADHYSQGQVAWRMVTELVAGLGIGFGIGLGLDTLLGTKPWLMVVFLGFGLAAGIKVMMQTAQEVAEKRHGAPGQSDDTAGTPAKDDEG